MDPTGPDSFWDYSTENVSCSLVLISFSFRFNFVFNFCKDTFIATCWKIAVKTHEAQTGLTRNLVDMLPVYTLQMK